MIQDNSVEWRKVVGYETRYMVSEYGEVYSVLKGRNRVISFTSKYPSVNLSQGGITKRFSVHYLVAAAFLGERPEGATINHIDCCKTNNHYSNLEYCTYSENIRHAIDNGVFKTGQEHYNATLKEEDVLQIRERLSKGEKICNLAREFNVNKRTVSHIKYRRNWKSLA